MRVHKLILAATLALSGCLASMPPQYRAPPAANAWTTFGLWTTVRVEDGRIHGELIAVDEDRILLLRANGTLTSVPWMYVKSGRVCRGTSADVVFWGIAGGASTLSHGWFLVASAPVWVGATTVTALDGHRSTLKEAGPLARFARFPQGLPEGVNPEALVLRPAVPYVRAADLRRPGE